MNKLFQKVRNSNIFLIVILFILFSFVGYSAFTSLIVDSPIDYYNSSSSTILINCTPTISDSDFVTNISIYLNTSGGQTEFNISNSSQVNSGETYGFTITDLSESQTINFTCVSEDNSSNILEATSRTLIVDLTFPLLFIDSPANTSYSTKLIDLNYSVIELNLDSVWNSNDSGVSNYTLTSNLSLAVWNEGSNTIILYANDSANNENSTSVTFSIDTTAPSITLNSPSDNYENPNNYITFEYTPTDNNLANCTLFIYDKTDTYTNTTLVSGIKHYELVSDLYNGINYKWHVDCFDALNQNTSSEERTVKIRSETEARGGSETGIIPEENITLAGLESNITEEVPTIGEIVNEIKKVEPKKILIGLMILFGIIALPRNGKEFKFKNFGVPIYLSLIILAILLIPYLMNKFNLNDKISSIQDIIPFGDGSRIATILVVLLIIALGIIIYKKRNKNVTNVNRNWVLWIIIILFGLLLVKPFREFLINNLIKMVEYLRGVYK